MSTIEMVLQGRRTQPAFAAHEIAARFPDNVHAAIAWCDAFTGEPSALLDDLGKDSRSLRKHRAAFALLKLALADHEPLRTWIDLAKEPRFSWDSKTYDDHYDGVLMSAILSLWQYRGQVHEFRDRLLEWVATIGRAVGLSMALTLCDYPEIAHAFLGPAAYRPPAPGACAGCPKHPRPRGDDCSDHLFLVIERLARKIETDPLDRLVLSEVPPSAILVERFGVHHVHRLLHAGVELPAGWRDVIDGARAASGDSDAHYAALLMLCADTTAHHDVVTALTEKIRSATDPAAPVKTLAEKTDLFARAFTGPGWGRDNRPRKLKPVARSLLDRSVWPTTDWQRLLKPLDRDPTSDVDEFDAQREVLAEGLLSIAKDDSVETRRRRRSLDALERLTPAGSGTWHKALSTIESPPELRARAREVQSTLRSVRDGVMDGELAIADACEALFRS